MHTSFIHLLTATVGVAAAVVSAQAVLSPEDAVSMALKANYSITLARDQTSEATVNRQSAVGSFLPGISASATTGGNFIDSATHLTHQSPTTTVGVSANWQIFDGFQSVNAYQRLKSTEKAAVLAERLSVEATVEAVLNGYYAVVLQKQLLTAIQELLGVAEDQANLARAKSQVGAGSKLDELTAIATLNEDSSSLLTQQFVLRQAKIQLNQLLARNPATDFDVGDSIPLQSDLPIDQFSTSLEDNNATILQAKAQQNAAVSGLQEAKGLWFPTLSAGVGYSAVPSALNSGPYHDNGTGTYSVNLTVPLFDQLQGHQAVSIARLQVRENETQVRSTEENIRAEFEQDREKFVSGLQQVDLENRDMDVAKQQDEAAHEQYKVGKITSLDLRTADQLLLSARSALITAYQNTKQAEIALKRLTGALILEPSAQTQGN